MYCDPKIKNHSSGDPIQSRIVHLYLVIEQPSPYLTGEPPDQRLATTHTTPHPVFIAYSKACLFSRFMMHPPLTASARTLSRSFRVIFLGRGVFRSFFEKLTIPSIAKQKAHINEIGASILNTAAFAGNMRRRYAPSANRANLSPSRCRTVDARSPPMRNWIAILVFYSPVGKCIYRLFAG